MKKAKEGFDRLVSGLKEGENVTFGQMEKLYAEAFLERFFERLTSSDERKRLEAIILERKMKAAAATEGMEIDEVDSNEFSVYKRELVEHELENARAVVATLGARPSIRALASYVDFALSERDWNLLDDVVGMSTEGKVDERIIERIALSDLEGGIDREYVELRKHFPDFKFIDEDVQETYKNILAVRNVSAANRIKQETRISPKREIVDETLQALYKSWREGDILFFLDVHRLRDKPIQVDEQLIALVFGKLDTELKFIEGQSRLPQGHTQEEATKQKTVTTEEVLEDLSEQLAYRDKNLSLVIQRKLLETGKYDLFCGHFGKAPHKITLSEMQDEYGKLADTHENRRNILKLINATGYKPKKQTILGMYSEASRSADREFLDKLKEATGVDIMLSGEDAAALLARYRAEHLENFEQEVETVRSWVKQTERDKLKPVIKSALLHHYIEPPGEEEKGSKFEKALEISKKYALGAEAELVRRISYRIVDVIPVRIKEKERELDLEPDYCPSAIGEKGFRELSTEFNCSLREARVTLKKMKKLARTFEPSLEDSEKLQIIEEMGIYLAMIHAAYGKKPAEELRRFVEEGGVEIPDKPIIKALVKIASKRNLGINREGVLDIVKPAVKITNEHISSAISSVLSENETRSIVNADSLRKMVAGMEYTTEQKGKMRRCFLRCKDNWTMRQALEIYNPATDWTEGEKPMLKETLIDFIGESQFDNFDLLRL